MRKCGPIYLIFHANCPRHNANYETYRQADLGDLAALVNRVAMILSTPGTSLGHKTGYGLKQKCFEIDPGKINSMSPSLQSRGLQRSY